jgi:hypothetical protein
MATYAELYGLKNDSALRNRVLTACVIAAEAVMNEVDTTSNHANRLIWAASVFASPVSEADRMFMAVLAANEDATVTQIQGASDAAIQTNVDNHVDLFATGG